MKMPLALFSEKELTHEGTAITSFVFGLKYALVRYSVLQQYCGWVSIFITLLDRVSNTCKVLSLEFVTSMFLSKLTSTEVIGSE